MTPLPSSLASDILNLIEAEKLEAKNKIKPTEKNRNNHFYRKSKTESLCRRTVKTPETKAEDRKSFSRKSETENLEKQSKPKMKI